MNIPTLKINGKEVSIPRPTMKMWRCVAQYDEINKDKWSMARLMDEHANMLATIYGLEDSNDIDPADILPGYVAAATYVINVAYEKMKNLPNAETETEEK